MRTIPNRPITRNFSLYELIESSLPSVAVKLNWQNIDQFMVNLQQWEALAHYLQTIRNMINSEFRSGNGGNEIGVHLTSAFRCRQWEIRQKRNGSSQHCVGAAADIQPSRCSNRMAVDIMQWLHQRHWPRDSGHHGGFAIKHPTYRNGIIILTGFLHYDLRGNVARWTY